MTEKDILKSINKHFIKALVFLAIPIMLLEAINSYFFENEPIYTMVIVVFSICGSTYIFRKVLVDLLVLEKTLKNK